MPLPAANATTPGGPETNTTETNNQHDTYGTIKDQSVSTLHGKLITKMPTAGEVEKGMLVTLWENELDEDEAMDANQANRIAEHLQRKFKQLLKHLNGKNPKPPPGWQALASAALGATLAQLDGVPETGARASDALAPAAELPGGGMTERDATMLDTDDDEEESRPLSDRRTKPLAVKLTIQKKRLAKKKDRPMSKRKWEGTFQDRDAVAKKLHDKAQELDHTRNLPLAPKHAHDGVNFTAYYREKRQGNRGAEDKSKQFVPSRYVRGSHGAKGFQWMACCQVNLACGAPCTNQAERGDPRYCGKHGGGGPPPGKSSAKHCSLCKKTSLSKERMKRGVKICKACETGMAA